MLIKSRINMTRPRQGDSMQTLHKQKKAETKENLSLKMTHEASVVGFLH